MYSLLPSPDAPGLACLVVHATGVPSIRSAERFVHLQQALLNAPAIRLLLVCAGGGDAWAPLAAAFAGQTRVQRVAIVGAERQETDTRERRYYAAEDRGAAWSWLRGAVPPVPAWGAPLLPAYAAVPDPAERSAPSGDRAARPLEKPVPVWPQREPRVPVWEVPTEVLIADAARQPGFAVGGYRGEW